MNSRWWAFSVLSPPGSYAVTVAIAAGPVTAASWTGAGLGWVSGITVVDVTGSAPPKLMLDHRSTPTTRPATSNNATTVNAGRHSCVSPLAGFPCSAWAGGVGSRWVVWAGGVGDEGTCATSPGMDAALGVRPRSALAANGGSGARVARARSPARPAMSDGARRSLVAPKGLTGECSYGVGSMEGGPSLAASRSVATSSAPVAGRCAGFRASS
jgi:hypothetical protein